MQLPVGLLLLALSSAGILQLTTAKLERLNDRQSGYGAERISLDPADVDLRQFSKEEALKSLPQQKVKRQAGQPTQNGRHVFEDGYRYGLVHYSGQDSEVIFVLTYNLNRAGEPTATNLYKSTDYGASFTNIEGNLDENAANPLLWPRFYVSPVNKNMLVFPSYPESRIYYSYDEGENWQRRDFTPSTIDPRSLQFSPTEDNWILGHDPTNNYLYVSTNLGADWKKAADYVDSTDFQWGDPDWESDSSTIYYNQYDQNDRNRGNFTVGLYTQTLPYGIDHQREFDTNLGRHDDFALIGPYIFAQKTRSNGDVYLLVSYRRQPFNEALIPTPYAHQNYIVTHLEERQALVIVEHVGEFFNLYLSDETGVYYSLSLRDIVVRNAIDLEVIQGVNGTMIANQYVRDDPSVTNAPIRTIITLDNGGNWELIHPPERDIGGAPVTCEPPSCSLHFHMDTSEYARLGVFSTESAPGIIIAHGTLGETLSDDPDLYISRDGGVSWVETLSDSWGVNVLDHGGVIVAAKDYHSSSSNELMYSCSEGLTWTAFDFSTIDITIYGVLTEPGEHTTVISLYGVETNKWVVVTVDFNPIFTGSCTDQDYYDWMPWDDRSDTDCILGSSVVIERRNINTCCLNGRDYVRETQYTICECNEEDFECDYGYARPGDDLSGLCARDPDVHLEDPCADGNATTYMASSGYRKIAGDVCQGGAESTYAPFEATCCGNSTEPPTQNTPDTPQTYTPPTEEPTASPSPCACSKTSQKDDHTTQLVGLGALFGIATLAALLLLVILVIMTFKYIILKKRFLKLITAGEQTFTVRSDRESSSEEPEPPQDDDDDAPLVP